MKQFQTAEEYLQHFGLQMSDLYYLKCYDLDDHAHFSESVRLYNRFKENGIKSLFDLIGTDTADLIKFENLGSKSMHEARYWTDIRKGVFLKDNYPWDEFLVRRKSFSIQNSAPNFYAMQSGIIEWVRDGNRLAHDTYPEHYAAIKNAITLTASVDPWRSLAEEEAFTKEHEKAQVIFATQKMQTYFSGKEDILGTDITTLGSPLADLQNNGVFIVAEVAYNNEDWLKERGISEERIPLVKTAMQNLGFEHGICYHDRAIEEYWAIQDLKDGVEKSRLEYGTKMGLKLG